MSIPSGNLLGDNSHNFHDSKDNIMGIVDLVVCWGIFWTGSHPLQLLQWETRESLHFFRNPWNHCHFMAIQPSSHFLVVRFVYRATTSPVLGMFFGGWCFDKSSSVKWGIPVAPLAWWLFFRSESLVNSMEAMDEVEEEELEDLKMPMWLDCFEWWFFMIVLCVFHGGFMMV